MYQKHGYSDTPTYRCWTSMRNRCFNRRNIAFHLYGGRGIKVCRRWSKFENFLFDMGEKPIGLSLDRIDNNAGYSPENCKWSTVKEQQTNRTISRNIEFNGKKMCSIDWARSLGITLFALTERLRKWPLEKALTHPRINRGPMPSFNSRRTSP